ncbi:MAG: DUF996 domain-containing protein [Thermoprotei archaeon]|nr:DUF996 domain-containing protein [Thermoprotei archaeon]
MSTDFEKARTLGIIGTAIIIFGVLISAFALVFLASIVELAVSMLLFILTAILSILGWVLVVISLYIFSRFYGEDRIFRNAIYFFISYIIAGVAGAISSLTVLPAIFHPEGFAGILIVSLLVGVLFGIIAFFFMYRSLSLLAGKSEEGLFRVAGLLLLVGQITSIIIIVNLILFVGLIVLVVAFASVKLLQPMRPEEAAVTPASPSSQ